MLMTSGVAFRHSVPSRQEYLVRIRIYLMAEVGQSLVGVMTRLLLYYNYALINRAL